MLSLGELNISKEALQLRKVFVLEHFRRDLAFAILEASRLIGGHVVLITWTPLEEGDRLWVEAFGAKTLIFLPITSRFGIKNTEVRSPYTKALGLLMAIALRIRIGMAPCEFLLVNNSFLLSRGLALLWRIGLVRLCYIPHGIHPINCRFVGDSILHFARIGLQHCLDRGAFFSKPVIRRVPYIQSIFRASELCRTHSVKARELQVTFLGGFEVDMNRDPVRISAYLEILNELYRELRVLFPEINLIYRPHPSHLPEFKAFSEKHLLWQTKPQSLTDDLLSSVAVLSYVSSGLVEAQELGIPVAQIGSGDPTEVLEFDQGLLDFPILAVPKAAARWVHNNSTQLDESVAVRKLLPMTLALASGIWGASE